MKNLVEKLIKKGKTISTMESCTGGALVNSITNIEGASCVLKYSAITYSNEFKIKMGVEKSIIEKYSVYSKEVAKNMAKVISDFTNSDYSVGITGKLGVPDLNNYSDNDNIVYICIFDRENKKYYEYNFIIENLTREENKNKIIEFIVKKLTEIV